MDHIIWMLSNTFKNNLTIFINFLYLLNYIFYKLFFIFIYFLLKIF